MRETMTADALMSRHTHYTDAGGLEFSDPEEFAYGWVSDPAKAMKLVIGTMS